MSKAQDLLERMDKGEAIIASNETLNALEVLGRDDIKSALNKDRVGTKDTYVVWTKAKVEIERIKDSHLVYASAKA